MPKDNFSAQADLYAKYRPTYPSELYDYLLTRVNSFDTLWDCGTGNGQVASVLADKFKDVIGTDISQKQLDHAIVKENISYLISPAEATPLKDHSVDLITVGQAIHWFDFDKFYKEVQRVSKPGAILSYWGYPLLKVNAEIDKYLKEFHDITVGEYWDPERMILENEYRVINFPLGDIKKKYFKYVTEWDLEHLEGYLNSWSSVQKYIRHQGSNPVKSLVDRISSKWPCTQIVQFNIFLTAGKVTRGAK